MNYPFRMTMTTVRYLTLFFVLSVFFFSCSNGEETRQGAATHTEIDSNLPLAEQIHLYIEQDRYDEALELLASEDPDSPDTLEIARARCSGPGQHPPEQVGGMTT